MNLTHRMLAYVQVLMMHFGMTPRLERIEAYLIDRYHKLITHNQT